MPYIEQKDRQKFNIEAICHLINNIDNCGDFNYIITKLMHGYMDMKGERYQHYNDLIGALECAKLELYRLKTAPYEEKKRVANGDVNERR